MYLMLVTLETSQLEMSLLKEFAPSNILNMLVTLLTFQLEMSPVKELAPANM
jgi:hypothetical protein